MNYGLFDDPDVLLAAKWQEWLHPRGLDGRFIEKLSMVDVFAQSGGKRMLSDPKANRRRARIKNLFPEGAEVDYYDPQGKPVPADAKAGYPKIIPLNQISKRVAAAPKAKARLTSVDGKELSSKEEFDAGYRPALGQDGYDKAIEDFNLKIERELNPSRSAAKKGIANEPISDEEYQQHFDFVTDVTDAALGKQVGDSGIGLASESALKDSYGRWDDASMERMLSFATDMYADLTAGKPQDRKAMVLGGLPGSGKTAKLRALADQGTINMDDWVVIDPDIVKERMIEDGWYPRVSGLTPNETAGFIHAQSSEMASMLERMMIKDGYNLIFDSTLGGSAGPDGRIWMDHTLDMLLVNNYDTPDGVFIDSTPTHSLASIASRHRSGLDKYRTGIARTSGDPEIDNGGRFVPTKVVSASMKEGGTSNLSNFERLRDTNRLGRTAVYEVGGDFVPGQIPQTTLVAGEDTGPNAPGAFGLGGGPA